jgi:septum formation protein
MGEPCLILASNSPRRRELLALGGWTFQVNVAEVDEGEHPGEAPDDYVLRLAKSKAQACAASAREDWIILAADTTVVFRGSILGKPRDESEAKEMLASLRGQTHQVYTGLALLRPSDGTLVTDLCVTDVPMRAYSDEELESYIASGDPLDKAGAYAIQHPGFHPVESLAGCYASVMGLPLCHLARSLRKMEITPKTDLPAACQSHLGYVCPIYATVLRGERVG